MDQLKEAILEYTDAKVAFEHCLDMLSSRAFPPDHPSTKISNRYFDARKHLETICKDANNALAQEYYTKAQLAHECSTILLNWSEARSAECSRRMAEYEDVTTRLLEFGNATRND